MSKQNNKFFISGRVLELVMPERFSEKMSKSMLILEVYAGQYKNEVSFEFINANMGLINGIQVGDWVNIDFILKGRKHINGSGKTNWYPSNEGISCTKED